MFLSSCAARQPGHVYIYMHIYMDVPIFISGSPVQPETPENLGTGTSKPGVTDDGQGGTRAIIYIYIYIFRASEVSCAPKLLEACDRRA